MDRRLHSHDHLTSQAEKQRTRLDDVPNLDDYTPAREIDLQKKQRDSLTKEPPRIDKEMYKYEDYLRNKWGCEDPIPESFDPYKLDASFRARMSTGSRKEKPSETRERPREPVAQPKSDIPLTSTTPEPQEIPSEAASLPSPDDIHSRGRNTWCESTSAELANDMFENDDERAMMHEITESTIDDIIHRGHITQARRRSNAMRSRRGQTSLEISAPSTPRILYGSKPPLSPSAYVVLGTPCKHDECDGQCKQVKPHVKPPQYFPFKGRAKRSSRSRSRSRERQA
ncbi:hypothetical protein F5Y09DRAFT_344240 [Xylaria sp. FL1042]|nr:hypothetical protein F5Y09DRAFT_344240 [Xylaria sp. FL1042]